VTPETALRSLAESVLASGSGRVEETLLGLAIESGAATGGFLARLEGDGLRLTCAREATGEELVIPARELERVAQAVQESLDGVSDAPPTMTGGEAPAGAVAVKADAGYPPVHAFPLHDPSTGEWEGVLGLHPDPLAADRTGSVTHDDVLAVVRGLLAGRPLGTTHAEDGEEEASRGPSEFKYDYGELVTRSASMHSVFKKLDRIIGTDVPVLITGPTGTGKELIARALHRNDPKRRNKRFYAQNCGAITESLLESELFGYEKGAFTGAERRKKGLFEIASGSTLFLDEIGEMSLEMQTKLLRVLQEGEIVPLGGSEPVPVEVRIVAATLRNLDADVEAGNFRADLFYRLKVVRLTLPPLRERPEDVPLLVDHFLRKVARQRGERPKVLDRRDERIMDALLAYPWPGNVRELENTVTRLAYLSSGGVISYQALAEEKHLLGEQEGDDDMRPVRPLDEVVEEVERAEIENALRHTHGNRTRAADLLGMNRRSLLRRLQKYGMQEGTEDGESDDS
jgi:two-component system, NtrC family, response regulator AtoC